MPCTVIFCGVCTTLITVFSCLISCLLFIYFRSLHSLAVSVLAQSLFNVLKAARGRSLQFLPELFDGLCKVRLPLFLSLSLFLSPLSPSFFLSPLSLSVALFVGSCLSALCLWCCLSFCLLPLHAFVSLSVLFSSCLWSSAVLLVLYSSYLSVRALCIFTCICTSYTPYLYLDPV